MARRIVLLETNVQQVIEAYDKDLGAALVTDPGEDDTAAAGNGAYVLTLLSPTLCMPVYLPRLFIRTFTIAQPTIPEAAKLFKIVERGETTDPPATTRRVRKQKSKGTNTDLSGVSYNQIKFATDGLVRRPTRRYAGGNQKLKYVSARFPRILTKDCINWFITNAFDGGGESDTKLPSHFIYGGSNHRVDYLKIDTDDLQAYTV